MTEHDPTKIRTPSLGIPTEGAETLSSAEVDALKYIARLNRTLQENEPSRRPSQSLKLGRAATTRNPRYMRAR